MNFKQSVFLVYIFCFLLETFCVENRSSISKTIDNNVNKEKTYKKYIRNDHAKKHNNIATSENITDDDLEEILKMDSIDRFTQNSFKQKDENYDSTMNENNTLLNRNKTTNITSRHIGNINKEKNYSNENNSLDSQSIIEDKQNDSKNKEKHNEQDIFVVDRNNETLEKEKEALSNLVTSDNTSNNIIESNNNENGNMHKIEEKEEKNIEEESETSLSSSINTNEKNKENTYNVSDEIIDILANLLFDDSDKNDKEKIHSSENGENEENLVNKMNFFENYEDEEEEEFDDIEPKIKKEIYYPLGQNKMDYLMNKRNDTINNQSMNYVSSDNTNNEKENMQQQIPLDEVTTNSEKAKLNESIIVENASDNDILSNNSNDTSNIKGNVSFLQNHMQEIDEDYNKEKDNNKEEENDDGVISDKQQNIPTLEEEKINEDTNIASFDMEEDKDENNKDDSSSHKKRKLIRNARKLYKINLFNCNYINEWDFSKEYIDEQGTLVKLSGYVFQNMLNSNSMPTTNIVEWKLKGVCDYDKYICGALKYVDNIYQKGDRIIYEGKIYEALNDTVKSPKNDDGSWIDKTSECF